MGRQTPAWQPRPPQQVVCCGAHLNYVECYVRLRCNGVLQLPFSLLTIRFLRVGNAGDQSSASAGISSTNAEAGGDEDGSDIRAQLFWFGYRHDRLLLLVRR